MKARHTTALYRTPRRIPDSATIEKPCNMHYLPLQNQPSAYIHKFLLSSSSSNTTHNNPSLLHHIKLPNILLIMTYFKDNEEEMPDHQPSLNTNTDIDHTMKPW